METSRLSNERIAELFEELGGTISDGFPAIHSPVYRTGAGTPYLKTPGVVVLAKPQTNIVGLKDFLEGFDPSLGFPDYLDDPTQLPGSSQLCKTAGQLCYASFGPKRTTNERAVQYFERLTSAGHGSVLEHANFSFLLYGISRSVTHELVRHRHLGFCLSGDTEIYCERTVLNSKAQPARRVDKRSIEHLYKMTRAARSLKHLKSFRIRCLDESTNTFTTGRIASVVESGKKSVFKVTLSDGKEITCSKDHRFLSSDGWKTLDEIAGGITVTRGGVTVHGKLDIKMAVNGVAVYKDRTWLKERYVDAEMSQREIAAEASVSSHTIRSWVRKHGLQKPPGSWSRGKEPWNKGRRYKLGWRHTPEACKRLSESKRGPKNPNWRGGITERALQIRKGVEKLRHAIYTRDNFRCRVCRRRSNKLTLHHILPIWARPDLALSYENLATVCKDCHLEINGCELGYVERLGRSLHEIPEGAQRHRPKERRGITIPKYVSIAKIEYVGERTTYDLEMEGPNHNFVANGIVTHNSQISQRYVSGRVLRFVERPEYQPDPELHELFEARADRAAAEYEAMAGSLLERQEKGSALLEAEYKTDARKKVQQTARSLLPNETEAPMVVTGNVRAWRHVVEMRADEHAESEIRALALRLFLCLVTADPILFGDYRLRNLPDGTYTVTTEYRKA